jgi:hypothetical protein
MKSYQQCQQYTRFNKVKYRWFSSIRCLSINNGYSPTNHVKCGRTKVELKTYHYTWMNRLKLLTPRYLKMYFKWFIKRRRSRWDYVNVDDGIRQKLNRDATWLISSYKFTERLVEFMENLIKKFLFKNNNWLIIIYKRLHEKFSQIFDLEKTVDEVYFNALQKLICSSVYKVWTRSFGISCAFFLMHICVCLFCYFTKQKNLTTLTKQTRSEYYFEK